jgi:hypothetical protein
VYAQLLVQRPGDARLQARVDALRGASPQIDVAPPAPTLADRDAWAADMWRAALAPVPAVVAEEAVAAAALPETAVPHDASAEADVEDLSFDRFFEAFGDEPDPAPPEPAGDFERWAADVDRAPAPAVPAAIFPEPAVSGPAVPDYTPDDPEADLAAFNAWLRGVDG